MEKTKKTKSNIKQILDYLAVSPEHKVIQESEVQSPVRDSIPLLTLNMVLQSAFMHPMSDKLYNPINILFISPSGSGKSRLIETLRPLDFVYYCEDITPKHIVKFLEQVRDGKKRFLAIPDFNSVICSHGQKTQHTTLSIFRELMSDGITNLSSYSMEFESKFPVKAGIVTAITIDNYNEFLMSWKKTGFLNRFMPYSSKHSNLTKDEILHTIFYNDTKRFIKSNPYNIIKHPKMPLLDGKIVELLKEDAEKLAKNTQATPYRDAIRLTDLLTNFLVIQGETTLTIDHILQFKKLIKFINYEFNEI